MFTLEYYAEKASWAVFYHHCSNITVINAASQPSQRGKKKVLKLPLVLLAKCTSQFDLIVAHLSLESCSRRQLLTIPFPCHEIAIASEHLVFNTSINLPVWCPVRLVGRAPRCVCAVCNCDVLPLARSLFLLSLSATEKGCSTFVVQ